MGRRSDADRNLLFGILALQMDFIGRDALIAAMHAWVLDKSRPLGRILIDQGALAESRFALIDSFVEEHLAQHGNDPEASLASLSSLGPVRLDLESIADPDLQASLAAAAIAPDPEATRTHAAGQATTNGGRFRVLRPHREGGLGSV